jgi:hypothetical protein
MTTHYPLQNQPIVLPEDDSRGLVSLWSDRTTAVRGRSIITLDMPESYDAKKLSAMDPSESSCKGTTGSLATLYGGMLSLMYAVGRQSEELPATLFRLLRRRCDPHPHLRRPKAL